MDPKPDYGEKTYKGSGKLAGKAALITGGDSGIGRAVALAFAREGADVLISYLNEEGDAKETARVVEAAGQKCVAVPGDITDKAHCKALVDRAVKEFGKIDVLVNNAAFQMTRESIEDISTDEFDRTMKTNLYAMFWLCREAVPTCRRARRSSTRRRSRPTAQARNCSPTRRPKPRSRTSPAAWRRCSGRRAFA